MSDSVHLRALSILGVLTLLLSVGCTPDAHLPDSPTSSGQAGAGGSTTGTAGGGNGGNGGNGGIAGSGLALVHRWSKNYGDEQNQSGVSIAVGISSNPVIAGNFEGDISLTTPPYQSAGGDDIFVAKLDSQGDHLWSKNIGGAEQQQVAAVAMDASGNVIVVGNFNGKTIIDGNNHGSYFGQDIFVAKYNTTGTLLFSASHGDPMAGSVSVSAVAIDDQENIIIAGTFSGEVSFGGDTLQHVDSQDLFVAKYNKHGEHQWSKRYYLSDLGSVDSLAVDQAGNVFLTGTYYETVQFGAVLDLSGDNAANNLFLVKISSGGNTELAEHYGGASCRISSWNTQLVITLSGQPWLVGAFKDSLDFGGDTLTSVDSSHDLFSVKFNASFEHQWSFQFGGSGSEIPTGLALVTAGAWLTGRFDDNLTFGPSQLEASGQNDIFVTRFDLNGKPLFATAYGDTEDDLAKDLATDVAGNIFLTGAFSGSLDFGAPPLSTSGGQDAFIAKFSP